jgi:hypothetical protein
MLLNFPPETVRSPTSFLVMHIIHAFFEQRTPCPHIPFINCSFTIHLLQQSSLWISAGGTFLAFKNHLRPALHRWRDFRFSSSLMNTDNGKNDVTTMQYTCYPWHAEHDWTSQEVRTSPARPAFTFGSYYLDAPCASEIILTLCVC